MSAAPPGDLLNSGRELAGLTVTDLWLRCQGIGGHLTPVALSSILAGTALPEPVEYDVIAQALNDVFVERGLDHPVPYSDDIGMVRDRP